MGIRRIIRACVDSGTSFEQIAATAELNSSAIKQFLNRNSGTTRESMTLNKLQDYILKNYETFDHSCKMKVLRYADLIAISDADQFDSINEIDQRSYDIIASRSYYLMYKLLRIHDTEIFRTCSTILGDFVFYRHSTVDGRIVISQLSIRQKNSFENIYEYTHRQIDHLNEERTSDGIIVPIANSFVLIGDIECGIGIENIVIKQPTKQNFKNLRGFIVSMDFRRESFTSRIFLERDNQNERKTTRSRLNIDFGSHNLQEIDCDDPDFQRICKFISNKNEKDRAMTVDEIF